MNPVELWLTVCPLDAKQEVEPLDLDAPAMDINDDDDGEGTEGEEVRREQDADEDGAFQPPPPLARLPLIA